jgi:signal transduction histidine kinase
MMSMLVHELRSPVNASKSMVSAMRCLDPGDERRDDLLYRVENRMDELLELVDDILALSQARAGQPAGKIAPVDTAAETRAICTPYLDEAVTSDVEMTIQLPVEPLSVAIARQAYHLIVSNLISNAVKYTPAGSVRVSLRREGGWAVLEVSDTGIGIPQSEIPRLCTEFYRASNARRSAITGTGLGLAGVRALVEDNGGRLSIRSQEGEGSRFTVRLPLNTRISPS